METVATGLQRIIFDMDDTLLKTGALYRRALRRLAERVVEQFPQVDSTDEVITRQEIIDQQQLDEKGFAKSRFPESLANTWQYFCEAHDRQPDPANLEECERLGWSVYDTMPEPLDGMYDLLEELQARFDLLLYTMGDPTVQQPKIRHHNLESYFEELHIVPDKSRDSLRRVVTPYEPNQVLIVGDSLRSEIKPALEIGVPCIYRKPEFPWSYHQIELDEDVPEIEALPELRQWLP